MNFQFVDYERLFQHIFYFVGFTNIEVNEINTNKLDWFVAKKLWNSSILDKLLEYIPFGPKEKLPSYKMQNKLLSYLETIDKEALGKYNFILARMANFLQLSNILTFILNIFN